MAQSLLLESVLKEGIELVGLGQKQEALQVFHDGIMSKRKGSQMVLDAIMTHHVTLCAELENSSLLREVLPIFRNLAQNSNPSSLQLVLETLRHEAEKRMLQLSTEHQNIESVPSDLLLVGTAKHSESTGNALHFLWETYKVCLDVLKINGKMANTYKDIGIQALAFCKEQQLRTGCAQLCETLRVHLINVVKSHKQNVAASLSYYISLNDDSTVDTLMKLRLAQMQTCLDLQLYQEAFGAIEDAYQLAQHYSEGFTPSSKSRYFLLFSKVMLQGGHWALHAYSYYLFINMNVQYKKFTEEDLAMHSTKLLLASLAVPSYQLAATVLQTTESTGQELNSKAAKMLFSNSIPSREVLTEKLSTKFFSSVQPWARELYELLHDEMFPALLVQRVVTLLPRIREDPELAVYAHNIEKLLFGRIIGQIVKNYTSIKMRSLARVVPFIIPSEFPGLLCEISENTNLRVVLDSSQETVLFKEHAKVSDLHFKAVTVQKLLQECAYSTQEDQVKSRCAAQNIEFIQMINENIENAQRELQSRKETHVKKQQEKGKAQKEREEQEKKEQEERRKVEEEEQRERAKQNKITLQLSVIEETKRKLFLDSINELIVKMKKNGFSNKQMTFTGMKVETMSDEQKLTEGLGKFENLYKTLLDKVKKQKDHMVQATQKHAEYRERAKRDLLNPILTQDWQQCAEEEIRVKREIQLLKYNAELQLKQRLQRVAQHKKDFIEHITCTAKQEYEQQYEAWRVVTLAHFKDIIPTKAAEQLARDKDREKDLRFTEVVVSKLWRNEEPIAVNAGPSAFTGTGMRRSELKVENPEDDKNWRTQPPASTSLATTTVKKVITGRASGPWRNDPVPAPSSFSKHPAPSGFSKNAPTVSGFIRNPEPIQKKPNEVDEEGFTRVTK